MENKSCILKSFEEFINNTILLIDLFKKEKIKSDKDLSKFNIFYNFFVEKKLDFLSNFKKVEKIILESKSYEKNLQKLIKDINELFLEMQKLEIKNIPIQKIDIEKEFKKVIPKNKFYLEQLKEFEDIQDIFYNLSFLTCYLEKYKEVILKERKVKTIDYLENNYPFLYDNFLNEALEEYKNPLIGIKFKEIFFDSDFLKEKNGKEILKTKEKEFIKYIENCFYILKNANDSQLSE